MELDNSLQNNNNFPTYSIMYYIKLSIRRVSQVIAILAVSFIFYITNDSSVFESDHLPPWYEGDEKVSLGPFPSQSKYWCPLFATGKLL